MNFEHLVFIRNTHGKDDVALAIFFNGGEGTIEETLALVNDRPFNYPLRVLIIEKSHLSVR